MNVRKFPSSHFYLCTLQEKDRSSWFELSGNSSEARPDRGLKLQLEPFAESCVVTEKANMFLGIMF